MNRLLVYLAMGAFSLSAFGQGRISFKQTPEEKTRAKLAEAFGEFIRAPIIEGRLEKDPPAELRRKIEDQRVLASNLTAARLYVSRISSSVHSSIGEPSP